MTSDRRSEALADALHAAPFDHSSAANDRSRRAASSRRSPSPKRWWRHCLKASIIADESNTSGMHLPARRASPRRTTG